MAFTLFTWSSNIWFKMRYFDGSFESWSWDISQYCTVIIRDVVYNTWANPLWLEMAIFPPVFLLSKYFMPNFKERLIQLLWLFLLMNLVPFLPFHWHGFQVLRRKTTFNYSYWSKIVWFCTGVLIFNKPDNMFSPVQTFRNGTRRRKRRERK